MRALESITGYMIYNLASKYLNLTDDNHQKGGSGGQKMAIFDYIWLSLWYRATLRCLAKVHQKFH